MEPIGLCIVFFFLEFISISFSVIAPNELFSAFSFSWIYKITEVNGSSDNIIDLFLEVFHVNIPANCLDASNYI